MIKKIILLIPLLLLFSACSSAPQEKLRISATTWIGYTPLYYAKEKGWLDELNIKLLNVSSLSENMYLYKAGNSDAYVGTQYEYSILRKDDSTLKPIMMFDRSNGGDIVLGNTSIDTLKNTEKTIDAYLEMDSINHTILKDFIKKHSLENKKIHYINKDQSQISILKAYKSTNPTIVITYVPYNLKLEKNGFRELASTKDSLDIFVIDAMFTTAKVFHTHEKQFRELKKLVDKSIESLKKDPKEFYEIIHPYLLEMSYEDFEHSLNDIIWINKDLTPELEERMNYSKFNTEDLI